MCQVAHTRPDNAKARVLPNDKSLGSRYPRIPISSARENVSASMQTFMRKLITALTIPPSGTTKEARGVAHTMADAATVISKVSPKAIHQTLIGQPFFAPLLRKRGRPNETSGLPQTADDGESPTTAGRAPRSLASQRARLRPAPPGGARHPKRQQGVALRSAEL